MPIKRSKSLETTSFRWLDVAVGRPEVDVLLFKQPVHNWSKHEQTMVIQMKNMWEGSVPKLQGEFKPMYRGIVDHMCRFQVWQSKFWVRKIWVDLVPTTEHRKCFFYLGEIEIMALECFRGFLVPGLSHVPFETDAVEAKHLDGNSVENGRKGVPREEKNRSWSRWMWDHGSSWSDCNWRNLNNWTAVLFDTNRTGKFVSGNRIFGRH